MKKRILSYALSTIACATITQTALSMHIAPRLAKYGISGLCSLTELLITAAPIVDKIIFQPNDLRTQKLKDTQSNAPQIVTDYITEIATEHGIENVKVVLNSNTHDYLTDDNGAIIGIPTKHAQKLESLLNNSNRNPQERKRT